MIYDMDAIIEAMTRADALRILRASANVDPGGRMPFWTRVEDAAARELRLEPDNYRARDNDNWPPNMRGRLINPTALRTALDGVERIDS